MKKVKILLFFIFVYLSAFTQTVFEKGYFVDTNNKKIECYIKNQDWIKNPVKFEYKSILLEDATVNIASINGVKEFAIEGILKYIKVEVDIDKSRQYKGDIFEISDKPEPLWQREVLFLKVLLDGKASLYYYEDDYVKRYFYGINDKIEQLEYKDYSSNGSDVKTNNNFQNQLQANFSCINNSKTIVAKINYDNNEIAKYLSQYNSCFSSQNVANTPTKIITPSKIKLKLLAGVASSKLKTYNIGFDPYTGIEKPIYQNEVKNGLALGIQLEYLLGFNNSKSSVILESSYESATSTADLGQSGISDFQFKSLEFNLGVRRYFYFNKTDAVFINLLLLKKIQLESKLLSTTKTASYYDSNLGLALGFGFKHNKLSTELRFKAFNENLNYTMGYFGNISKIETSRFNVINFQIGYSIF